MSGNEIQPGQLYVVATPIGNLGDLSPRALKVLDGVDRIAAEDTRVTAALLGHFGVRGKLVALHEHNEAELAAELVDGLLKGQSLALVSDAGTPLLSDPGYVLVRSAREAGVVVVAVPGPCAVVAALSIAGLPTDQFVFAGFLPAKSAARKSALRSLAGEPRTVVIYESTHRIVESLGDLAEVLGPQRRVCLARELTKVFEQSRTAAIGELLVWVQADANRQRGEFVLVIEPAAEAQAGSLEADRVLQALLPELGASRAAKVAAAITGLARKDLYARALELTGHAPGEP